MMETGSVLKGGVFALGNFDGVHRGHQAVIKAALEKAGNINAPARVLTLEPHPRSLFKPDIPPFRLTPAAAKVRYLRALGVQDVIVLPFTHAFSQMPATEFVQNILVSEYGAQHVVAGFDFVFGHDRLGTMQKLREWLAPNNVAVTEVTPFRDTHGEVMSSSRTREALRQGDLATAEHILGRPWSISGVVERGAQRGTKMGVPTANISLGEHLRPKFGVYAVNAWRIGSSLHRPGIANIGNRPTVDGKTEMLEVHLFDFRDDIYGQEWEVELVHFIRPEQAFSSVDDLRTQIMHDIRIARGRLK
jgi:riboflavin kinase / FMN adenylyltransferase